MAQEKLRLVIELIITALCSKKDLAEEFGLHQKIELKIREHLDKLL